jgi:hypothetical protein
MDIPGESVCFGLCETPLFSALGQYETDLLFFASSSESASAELWMESAWFGSTLLNYPTPNNMAAALKAMPGKSTYTLGGIDTVIITGTGDANKLPGRVNFGFLHVTKIETGKGIDGADLIHEAGDYYTVDQVCSSSFRLRKVATITYRRLAGWNYMPVPTNIEFLDTEPFQTVNGIAIVPQSYFDTQSSAWGTIDFQNFATGENCVDRFVFSGHANNVIAGALVESEIVNYYTQNQARFGAYGLSSGSDHYIGVLWKGAPTIPAIAFNPKDYNLLVLPKQDSTTPNTSVSDGTTSIDGSPLSTD